MNENYNEELDIVTLTDEDGIEYDYEIIGSVENEGNLYFALVPAEDEVIEEYVVLKAVPSDDESSFSDLIYIEDNDEFERVAAIFDTMLNEEE